jgi:ligand-binding SRPBCC domain-containing protein
MAGIHLTTFIAAPTTRVFDLTRTLAVYKYVFNSRKEKFTSAAGGNLLSKGDTVSIIAKHLGKERVATLKITTFDRPLLLVEELVKGDLLSYRHEHHFKPIDNGTIVIDIIDFGVPRDFVGRYLGKIYFKNYLEELTRKRNEVIRSYAETEKWRAVLS